MGNQRIKLEFLIHDLKVPLAIIEAGIIALLKREDKYGPLTEKQRKVLKRALRNTFTTKTLVNDTLELGRSTEGIINKNKIVLSGFIEQALVELFDLVDCDATDSIKSCPDLSVFKRKLSEQGILLDIDDGLWCRELSLDEHKMSQILRNLLNNALKYRKAQVVVKIETSNGYLSISVSDDGQGIPEIYHKTIFESYFQMDQKRDHCVRGHGLGLAGVMVLVEDMGGELLLESDVGKGAKFSVKVPLGSS